VGRLTQDPGRPAGRRTRGGPRPGNRWAKGVGERVGGGYTLLRGNHITKQVTPSLPSLSQIQFRLVKNRFHRIYSATKKIVVFQIRIRPSPQVNSIPLLKGSCGRWSAIAGPGHSRHRQGRRPRRTAGRAEIPPPPHCGVIKRGGGGKSKSITHRRDKTRRDNHGRPRSAGAGNVPTTRHVATV